MERNFLRRAVRRGSRLAVCATLALLLSLLSVMAYGQLGSGTIQGTVTDTTSAVVPDANVTVTNTATNAVMNVMTNSDSNYTVPNLLAGDYNLNQADPEKVKQFGLAGTFNHQVANPSARKLPGPFGGATISQAQLLRPIPYISGITASRRT